MLLLFLIDLAPVSGQSVAASAATDSSALTAAFLSGRWKNDSSKAIIEFSLAGRQLKLLADNLYTYHFFKTNDFPLQEVSISWPPHDCSIKKRDTDQIEITFISFGGGKPFICRYKRITVPGT